MPGISRVVVRALRALGNSVRIRIIDELLTFDELTFSDVQEHLRIAKAPLNFHLKKLTAAGLVEHFYRHTFGDGRYSYYGVTDLGRRLFNGIVASLLPPSRPNSHFS